jgi:uncharacterized repeat protein (TIGR03803 family)
VIGLRPVLSSSAAPASKEKVLYAFTGGADGGQPMSDLTLDAAGNLYGTTSVGGTGTACGSSGCGTVFELQRTKDGWKEQVLYSFAGGTDGIGPEAGVIFDGAGNFYGTTAGGGVGGAGTVFKLAPNSHGGWTESVLFTFPYDWSAGYAPRADLAFDAHGNLFGTASGGGTSNKGVCHDNGCGTVFELTPRSDGSWTETTIYGFGGAPDAATPSSAVLLDSSHLYGTTSYGGAGPCNVDGNRWPPNQGCGTVYKLTHNSAGNWTESVLYSFSRGLGSAVFPSSGLLLDVPGHLLGMSLVGGDGYGAVFELKQLQTKWEQTVLHRFYGNPDGRAAVGRLLMDTRHNVIGVTSYGGAKATLSDGGTVFELHRTKDGWQERVLHSFAGGDIDGSVPKAGMVVDTQGVLYGTTHQGGGSGCNGFGCGTVYQITP